MRLSILLDPPGAPDPTMKLLQEIWDKIGNCEATNAQYAQFLNAVAAADPNALASTSMENNARGGITRSGVAPNITCPVRPFMGDKPVDDVSWYDALI